MQMETEFHLSGTVILRPAGRIDAESSASVRDSIFEIVDQGAEAIIVDLNQVDFMDSSGLSTLVSGHKLITKRQGWLCICNPNAQIRTALRLTMLDRVLPIFDSVEAALASPERPPKE